MAKYQTQIYVDYYNEEDDEDIYSYKLQQEEDDYYYDKQESVYYFPEVLCLFIDYTFHNRLNTSGYNDILKFVLLYDRYINNYIDIYKLTPHWKIDIHDTYFLQQDDFNFQIECIQAFINSDFGLLPNELIAIILIGRNNYLKFLPL